ncbi:hypothetical protein VHEMI10705 [[Torrubiella] hemipterigena]|uniref:Uncharacterized protein n=1 Tax=[Torrubiella] hemipterigena TaxID=1531966 RepID=A0A0A1TSD2_9HYPO|nr:hypothetical protein VHEMI10705 [[Torrubiella] hemipterigena]
MKLTSLAFLLAGIKAAAAFRCTDGFYGSCSYDSAGQTPHDPRCAVKCEYVPGALVVESFLHHQSAISRPKQMR